MVDRNFQAKSVDKFSDWTAAIFFLLGLALLNNALDLLTQQTNLAMAIVFIALSVVMMLPHSFPANLLLTNFFIRCLFSHQLPLIKQVGNGIGNELTAYLSKLPNQ